MKDSTGYPKRSILVSMLVVASLAFLLCIVSYVDKVQNDSGFCDVTGSNCGSVQNSSYSSFFGVDLNLLGALGFFLFIVLLVFRLLNPKAIMGWLILLGSVVAGVFAIYLIVVQVFVLKQTCLYCMMIDSLSILLLGLTLYSLFHR